LRQCRSAISTPACVSSCQNLTAPMIEDFHDSRKQGSSDQMVTVGCQN
jgi:hypothetical protein